MQKVAVYCRVSTKKQERHGISLPAQEAKCLQYAKYEMTRELGEDVDVVFIGIEAISAKDTNRRPVFRQIEQMINKRQIQHLVTVKQDRLNRDSEDSSHILKLMCKKSVTPHFVCEGGKKDLNDHNVRFVLGIGGLLSEYERAKISLNTRLALSHKRDQGLRVSGRAPFGYRFDNNLVVEDAAEQHIISRILELRGKGFSFRAIQRQLEIEGYRNRKGNAIGRNEIWTIIDRKAA